MSEILFPVSWFSDEQRQTLTDCGRVVGNKLAFDSASECYQKILPVLNAGLGAQRAQQRAERRGQTVTQPTPKVTQPQPQPQKTERKKCGCGRGRESSGTRG